MGEKQWNEKPRVERSLSLSVCVCVCVCLFVSSAGRPGFECRVEIMPHSITCKGSLGEGKQLKAAAAAAVVVVAAAAAAVAVVVAAAAPVAACVVAVPWACASGPSVAVQGAPASWAVQAPCTPWGSVSDRTARDAAAAAAAAAASSYHRPSCLQGVGVRKLLRGTRVCMYVCVCVCVCGWKCQAKKSAHTFTHARTRARDCVPSCWDGSYIC